MPPRVTEGEHFFHTTTLGRRRGWRDTLSHIDHWWVPETVSALIHWPRALRSPPGRVVILPGMSLAPDESTYEERRVRPFFLGRVCRHGVVLVPVGSRSGCKAPGCWGG